MNIVFGDQKLAGRTVKHKLHTGQTITLTPADAKMLRAAYDHIQGYDARAQLQKSLQSTQEELQQLGLSMGAGVQAKKSGSGSKSVQFDSPKQFTAVMAAADEAAGGTGTGFDPEAEAERLRRTREEFRSLEERLAVHVAADNKVSFRDVESIMRDLGIAAPQKRVIDQMIWEVDEMADGVVCWDEFQLAYYRSVNDTTANEPQSFFRLIEFLIFDPQHKGYVIEDDCMEILFARIGGKNLERELRSLFGNKLRALGGDGTLGLEGYLLACLAKTGRRALLF